MIITSAEEQHLLDAVLDAPDDDAPRLVLADALMSRGEPFGDALSLSIRLAQSNVNWDAWEWNVASGARGLRENTREQLIDDVLEGRRNANGVDLEVLRLRQRLVVLEGSRAAWGSAMVPGASQLLWRRGFPAQAEMTAEMLLRGASRLQAPIERMVVTECDLLDPVMALSLAWVKDLQALVLRANEIVHLPPLDSPGATSLETLTLELPQLVPGALHRMVGGLEHVEALSLPATEWSDADFDALITRAPALRELQIEALIGDTAISRRWLELLSERPEVSVHFESTKLTAERFEALVNDHSTWGLLGEYLEGRQPTVAAPTNRRHWGRVRFW